MKNNLKELRKRKEMTQREISEMLGVTQRAYQNYEVGRRTPPLDIALKLSNIFMCNIDLIFFNN